MQAVAEKTEIKNKKRKAPLVVTFIIFLLIAAFVFYWGALRVSVEQRYSLASFTDMPVDTAGNNLAGNLPENLQAGGFMAGQNGWIYFANFDDNGALYMCREGGGSMVKLTDFPVANINVMSDTLVFTGLEQCYAANADGVYKVQFTSRSDMFAKIQGAYKCWYGGPLYAIYGINSIGRELSFALIEADDAYFFPYLDKDGLFVSSGKNILTNALISSENRIGEPDERIAGQYIHGDVIYLELWGNSGSRIIRADKKSLQPLDSLRGETLHSSGNGFVFHDSDSGFIYHISPDGNEIVPISAIPVKNMTINQLGEITGVLSDGSNILISDKLYYPDIIGRIMAFSKRIILQNGWYNYLAPSDDLMSYIQYPGIFSANGEYYQVGRDGVWLKGGSPVEWMRVQLLKSVTSKDMFAPKESFTPSWMPAAADEAAVPEITADFGNEATVDDAAAMPSASADPRNALDAAILLLRKDDSIYDIYSAESVDALKRFYGGSLDMAIDAVAQELSGTIGSQLGVAPDHEMMAGMIASWLEKVKYSIGNAKINTDTSIVALSTSNVIDSSLIYSAVQAEVVNRASKNPALLFKSKDLQAAWALDVLLEILDKPEQYNILSLESVENNVTMQNDDDSGWVVQDLAELFVCFARGM